MFHEMFSHGDIILNISMVQVLIGNTLISSKQVSFKQGGSCIKQLLSITQKCMSFDDGFEMRDLFLDISEGFDKVWYKSIIFKLKQNGTFGKLLSVFSDLAKEDAESYFKRKSFFMDSF